MLICSESRLIPTSPSIMVLKSDDDRYYYIHRSLYDQAVILKDKYEGKEDELVEAIGWTGDLPECVEYFTLIAPKPIDILGYFLLLIRDCETLIDDSSIDVLCGVIHAMSSTTNFRKMLKYPKDIRADITFSLSIKEEYQLSWERFFQESIPYDDNMFMLGAKAYVGQLMQEFGGVPSRPVSSGDLVVTEQVVDANTSLDEIDDILTADTSDFSWDDFLGETTDNEDKSSEESKPAAVSAPVLEETETEEPAVDTGLSMIMAMANKRKTN